MGELAKHSKENGVRVPKSYGANPNDAHTWDAHRIMGCLCDEGFEGYDCSQRTCPLGNDPAVHTGVPEVTQFESAQKQSVDPNNGQMC